MTPASDTSQQSRFQNYWLDGAYDEMFEAESVPRAHYERCTNCCKNFPSGDAPQEAVRRRLLSAPGHHLHRLWPRRGYRAHLSARPAAAHHHQLRMGDHRTRPHPTHYRAESLSARYLPRGALPGRRYCAARDCLFLQALSAPDARACRSEEYLHHGGRHGPDPHAGRALRRARRQLTRAERRVLHVDVPPGDETHLSRFVPQGRRAVDRSL